jgi:hypothetical protein
VELDDDGTTLRAVATGMVGLSTGALPGRSPHDAAGAQAVARELGLLHPEPLGAFWVCAGPAQDLSPVVVLDRFGDAVASGLGAVRALDGSSPAAPVAELVERATRRRGPVTVAPKVWVLQGNRATQVPPDEAAQACEDLDPDLGPGAVVIIQG